MNLQVLVIDDDNSVRASLLRVLRGGGYIVAEACDGKAGMDLALRLRPDAILMDVVIDGQNGLDAVRALKNHPQLAAIPIIALTALPDSARQAASLFDAVLTKPCLSAELFRTIEERVTRGKPTP